MDWNKWIIERLPRRLRVVGMFVLCVVLTSYIKQLHDEFIEWRRKLRIRMAGTPQVCQLKKIVHDELGLDIQIEEGNGKPIDFIIKTSFVDIDKERRLFALLDRYKLAGKSYGYENAEITLTATWSRFVCERIEVKPILTWGGFVCEVLRINAIRVTYYWKYPLHENERVIMKIRIRPDFPVKTELLLTYDIHLTGNDENTGMEHCEKLIGLDFVESYTDTWFGDKHSNEAINIKQDEYYKYIVVVEDVYE